MDNTQKELNRSLESLGRGFSSLSQVIGEYSESLGDAMQTMGSALSAVTNLYDGINGLTTYFTGFKEQFGDSSIVTEFGANCTESVEKIGSAMSNLNKKEKDLKGTFSNLAGSIKEKFAGVRKTIDETLGQIPKAFSNLKSFSFSDLGAKLTSGAQAIGSKAGSLLSAGLVGGAALAVAAIAGLVAAFQHLMESNEAFREKIETAWAKVTEAFRPAIEAFEQFKEALFAEGEDGEMPAFVQMILDGAETIINCISEAVALISEIVTGIFAFLTELWMEHGDSISALVTGIVDTVTGIISGVIDIVSGIIDVIVGFFTGDGNRITTGVQQMWEGVTGIFAAAWDAIMAIFKNTAEWFGNLFERAFTYICEKFEPVTEFCAGIWAAVKKLFAGVGTYFKEKFTAGYNGVKSAFGGVVDFFSGIWTKIKKLFTGIGTTIGNGIAGAFKTVVNSVIGFAQNTINGFIRAINGAIGMINKLPGVSIGTVSTLSIPRLAAGGLVDAGQMFVAREAGPELVGTFGAKTAVMNNDQIVESVSRGVFEAVKAAMSGDGSYTFNIVNKLDGKEIGRQVINYHNGIVRQTGVSPLMI